MLSRLNPANDRLSTENHDERLNFVGAEAAPSPASEARAEVIGNPHGKGNAAL
jgi:hypothetical protein